MQQTKTYGKEIKKKFRKRARFWRDAEPPKLTYSEIFSADGIMLYMVAIWSALVVGDWQALDL